LYAGSTFGSTGSLHATDARLLPRPRLYQRLCLGASPRCPLRSSVSAMRLALICTAGPGDRSHRDERNRRHVWSGLVANPPASFDTDVAWDGESTHTDDRETFLPIDAAQRLVANDTLGEDVSAPLQSLATATGFYERRRHGRGACGAARRDPPDRASAGSRRTGRLGSGGAGRGAPAVASGLAQVRRLATALLTWAMRETADADDQGRLSRPPAGGDPLPVEATENIVVTPRLLRDSRRCAR
jgi:hypothetical protein